MTCKNCVNHKKCDRQGKLMLTIDEIYELIYQHGVNKSCPDFTERRTDNDL